MAIPPITTPITKVAAMVSKDAISVLSMYIDCISEYVNVNCGVFMALLCRYLRCDELIEIS